MIHMILLILALLLFVAAGVGVTYGKLQLGWLGLACWAASMLVGAR